MCDALDRIWTTALQTSHRQLLRRQNGSCIARVVVGTDCWQLLQILRGINDDDEDEDDKEEEAAEGGRGGVALIVSDDADADVLSAANDDDEEEEEKEEEASVMRRDLLSTTVPLGIAADDEADVANDDVSLRWVRGIISAEIV